MNHLLYNIAIVMLLLGIIIMTSYLTRVNTPQVANSVTKPTYDINENIQPTLDQVFQMKPTQIYDSMFMKPSLDQGYAKIT
jgi:hypothetical protein